MTISPDTPPTTRPDFTERDFSQRAEETTSRSKGVKVAWVLFLLLFSLVGIYVLVILFSIGVQIVSDGTPNQAAQEQQEQGAPPAPAAPDPINNQ